VDLAEIIKALREPDALARPMPMWFWNGRLDHGALVAQMDGMLEGGVRAFFIHPMPQEFRTHDFVAGLEVEYLGDEFMRAVRVVTEAAAARGMKVWLYDEGGWPSGHNLGRVPAERPDLRGKVARYNEGGQVEILERGYPVDLLDPETTRTFIHQVHDRYATAVGEFFGTTIPGVFTDEPRFGGRVGGAEIPWTPRLPEIFRKEKGYDLRLGLAVLFGLKAALSLAPAKRAQVICDFYDVVTHLWRESYFRPLQEWCHAHGLLLVGHICGEDTLAGHVIYGGDFFGAMKHMDWPGLDAIWRQIHPAAPPNDFPKFASSAAHVTGARRVLSESFADYGWDLTLGEMKWITDFQYVRGVNALAPMAFYADTRGARKIGTMSDQFGINPLRPHYRDYADYVGRIGTLGTLGRPVVEVGVYYPIRSMWVAEDAGVERDLAALGRRLLARQIDFDYLDDAAIRRAEIADGALAVGDCRYRALVFPRTTVLPLETARHVRAFADAGGIVRFPYGRPTLAARAADEAALADELGAIGPAGNADLDAVVASLPRTAHLAAENPDIRACRRTSDGAEIVFLTNESPTATHAIRIRPPAAGSVCRFDPETGDVALAPMEDGLVALTLPPSGSVALLIGEGDLGGSAGADVGPPREPTRGLPIDGPWTARMREEWTWREGEVVVEAGARPGTTADALASWDTLFGPAVCGTARYGTTFALDGMPRWAVLDLGVVGVVAEVALNGRPVGRRIWAPYRLDVTDALVAGRNTLSVDVTSTLGRLMSSPEVVADLTARGWFNGYAQRVAEFGAPTAPAGLLGPVRLEVWE